MEKIRYWNKYSKNYSAWCVSFAVWCARQAGMQDQMVDVAGTYSMMEYYASQNRLMDPLTYEPKAGDLLFWDGNITNPNDGGHTAVVVYYDKATGDVYTVDGNYSNEVKLVITKKDFLEKNNAVMAYGANGGQSFGVLPDQKAARRSLTASTR